MPALLRFPLARVAACTAMLMSTFGPFAAWAAESDVIAVVAIDPYADIRNQLTWVGEQVGNPTLAGFAESFILLATQGKGLAGLDVKRPVGIVVTSNGGPLPTAHAFVPVKDLAKLLGAIQGLTGPIEEDGDVRRIAPPGGMPLEITEKNGWAVLSQPGEPIDLDDPTTLIGPLSETHTLAVELFPSRMPAELRNRLNELLEEAARNAAERGQPMDDATLRAGVESLEHVEKLVVGFAVDVAKETMRVDVTSTLTPEAGAALKWPKVAGTIASPDTANGKPAAMRGHYVAAIPKDGEAAMRTAIDQVLSAADDTPRDQAIAGLLRDMIAAMLQTGTIDAGFTIDTSAASEESPLPAITIGMKVKDGAALQSKIKERLSKPGVLPEDVAVAFDTGKEGDATLHEITIDTSKSPATERLGDHVKVTLAVTPDYAYLMAGGDVKKRLATTLAAAGKPVPDATPFVGVDTSLAALVDYAARMTKIFTPENPQSEALDVVAAQAAEKESTAIRLSATPIERGFTFQLSIDGGALQTVVGSSSVSVNVQPNSRPMAPIRPMPRQNIPSLAP